MQQQQQPSDPPQWAMRLVLWICPSHLSEGVLGDFLEQYDAFLLSYGKKKALQAFYWNVLRLFHPYLLFKNQLNSTTLNMGLFKSHMRIAARSMMQHKFYSAINILGLSSAIAMVFLVASFLINEFQYDQFHSNKNNLYRLDNKKVLAKEGTLLRASGHTPVPLAPLLKESLPQIKEFCRIGSGDGIVISNGSNFKQQIHFTDPSFLTLLDFPLVEGNSLTALSDMHNAVISVDLAKKYFGYDKALGQPIQILLNDSLQQFVVTGIIDNKKQESSIEFDVLLPIHQFKQLVPKESFESLNYSFIESFILLDATADIQALCASMTGIFQEHDNSEAKKPVVGLTALANLYFENQILGNTKTENIQKLWLLSGITLLVLVVASINFITLSTSHALLRIKEIGLRKSLGALKNGLRIQFIIESFLVVSLASLSGLLLAHPMLPLFNAMLHTQLEFSLSPGILGILGFTCISISLVAGLIQGILLSKADPKDALKGKLGNSIQGNNLFNKSLTTVQFALSISLIICTLILNGQMKYIQNKDLGFDYERLVGLSIPTLENPEAQQNFYNQFKALSMANSHIEKTTACMNPIKEKEWSLFRILQENGEEESVYGNLVAPDYLSTMNIQLLLGKNFDKNTENNQRSVIVNQALLDHFNIEDPLNSQIPGKNFSEPHQIIGVVKDFHFNSLHSQIQPMFLVTNLDALGAGFTGATLQVWPPAMYQILVKIPPGDATASIEALQNTWETMDSKEPFNFTFADQTIAANYENDNRYKNITLTASIFAIFIAWMGLMGMTRLYIQRKTKEVGVRKVLGASNGNLSFLLSKPFLLQIGVATAIACPVSLWLCSEWLNNFTYRIAIGWSPFLIATTGILLLTLLSVGGQAYSTATLNPTDNIKQE